MPPQIVCLSCGYHRTWPTLLEALADGHHHHAEHPAAALPESRERRCPYCKSDRIAPGGRISAGAGRITLELRCAVCRLAFVIVGNPLT